MRISAAALIAALFAFVLFPGVAAAAVDHSEFIEGPFNSGEDVTKACLDCHEDEADDILQTNHWKWKGPPNTVKGMEKSRKEYGKANLINNFCADIEGGAAPFCAKCHIGYSACCSINNPDEGKAKIDCLVCHTKDHRYKKSLNGMPDPKLLESGKLDLVKSARSVGLPDRRNCGVCHFFAGGGDAVKNGDLDTSLIRPKRDLDVHMGGSADMTCQECHMTKDHRISGASTFTASNEGRVSCPDCHRAPHRDSNSKNLLNIHTKTVACQTCHIPAFARAQATKMYWDWSTVGQDIEPEEQFGKETFAKHKGSFVWARDVIPEYAWYNGKIERYLKGQKIKDPSKTVYISRPVGDIRDKDSKIFPFKVMRGKQPMDSKFKYLSIFQSYGGLWLDYDWEKALVNGAKASGLPYSGKFQFVSTAFYGSINHMVAPKEDALKCGDCHFGRNKRLNWKALGYEGDPMRVGVRKAR